MISHKECIRVLLDNEYKVTMNNLYELVYSDHESFKLEGQHSINRLRAWNRFSRMTFYVTAIITTLNQLISLIHAFRR